MKVAVGTVGMHCMVEMCIRDSTEGMEYRSTVPFNMTNVTHWTHGGAKILLFVAPSTSALNINST